MNATELIQALQHAQPSARIFLVSRNVAQHREFEVTGVEVLKEQETGEGDLVFLRGAPLPSMSALHSPGRTTG